MGIIRAPQQIIQADVVPELYTEAVLLETEEYVAVEVITRQHVFLKLVCISLAPLSVGVVHPIQEVRYP